MATSPTSKSAPLSNAAKDDTVGTDGNFEFTIAQLLDNDAGSANSFFFGSGDNGGLTQAEYMELHGISLLDDGVTYLATGGMNFEYTVRVGNKGTYSTAEVDVADAPEEPCNPVDILTNGGAETVSAEASAAITDNGGWAITPVEGWTNSNNAGVEVWNQDGLNLLTNYLQLLPGSSYAFETDSYGDNNGALSVQDVITTSVDANAGEEYTLSFDYASRQTYTYGEHTDEFEVFFNGESIGKFDPTSASQWTHFEKTVYGQDGTDTLEIRELGANDSIGSVIDNVQLVAQCGCDWDLIV